MAIAVKENTVYAVEIEVTEGTYVPPSSATKYVQTLSDGAEMVPTKELLERNIFDGSIGKVTPRVGMRSVTGSMPVEMRAGSTEGAAPEYDALMRAALGSRRQVSATTIDDADAGGPHTTTRLFLLDADASKYEVGDIVVVKKTGAYHTSPVSAVSNTPGNVYIDLLVAAGGAFTDGDEIAALTTYLSADSGHPTLSISKYIETTVREYSTGCRVTSMALEGFQTGQLASWNFGFEGLDYDRSLSAQPHTPSYSSTLPPIILEACVYLDGAQIQINELAFSLENAIGFATSTCASNGKFSSRITQRTITGSMNPYKLTDSVAQYTRFENNTEFSLFGRAYIPGSTGEYENVVSFYLPKCVITGLTEGDQDGLLQDSIEFMAGRGSDGASEELYISVS